MGIFWDNFSRLCEARDTSPSATVRAIGLSPNRSSRWKNDGTIPTEGEMLELARELHCQIEDFWKVKRKRGPEDLIMEEYDVYMHKRRKAEEVLDDNERALIDLYQRLDRKERLRLMLAVYDFEEAL